MVNKKDLYLVCFGGWYQRTTLHLTELFEFLVNKKSRLYLDESKLKTFHEKLNLKNVERKTGYLEYLKISTKSGIRIEYHEDGLYVFSEYSDNIEESGKKIKKYYEDNWKPAIDYLFSLGAPTPKILANMRDENPIVVGASKKNIEKLSKNKEIFGIPYSEASSKNELVIKTNKYIFVGLENFNEESIMNLVDMQIFFREFKIQLHKYLNIHRRIWEDITEIKEKKEIKGKEIAEQRAKLEMFKKTIDIIRYRINQMHSYAKTRRSVSERLNIQKDLITLFDYRFEDLFDTLDYIKEIWEMTVDYVNSSLRVIEDLSQKSEGKSIKSIQLLASIGVITGLLRYAEISALPSVSKTMAGYLIILGLIAFSLDWVLTKMAKEKKYQIKFVETSEKI
jgi:hypothetical protein